MSEAGRPEPVRSCIGCRRRRSQSDLVRVTRSAAGIVVGGSSDGRGAWVCAGSIGTSLVDAACLDAAFARGAFGRAWRVGLDPDDERTIRAKCQGVADDDKELDAQ